MKTIEELLKNLARPEVLEFGLVTNRLPSVNIGGKFEPVDDEAPSTERLMQMLVTMGGSRYVDSLNDKPVQWTTRLDGVGVIAVAAIMRKDIVQARFTVAKRDGAVSLRPAANAQPALRQSDKVAAGQASAATPARAAQSVQRSHESRAAIAATAAPQPTAAKAQPTSGAGPAAQARAQPTRAPSSASIPAAKQVQNQGAKSVGSTAAASVVTRASVAALPAVTMGVSPASQPTPAAAPQPVPPQVEEEWDDDDEPTLQTLSPPVTPPTAASDPRPKPARRPEEVSRLDGEDVSAAARAQEAAALLERAAQEKAARERAEQERAERERAERERAEQERVERERAEQERVERERAEQERIERERAERERAEQERAAQEKAAQEKAAQEKAAQEKAAQEKAAQEKAAQEKAAQEKAAQEKAAQEKAAQEKAAREKAAQEKAAREKAAREKAAQEKAAQEKAAQEKAAQEKAAQERAAQEKAAHERATQELARIREQRAAQERQAREREAADIERARQVGAHGLARRISTPTSVDAVDVEIPTADLEVRKRAISIEIEFDVDGIEAGVSAASVAPQGQDTTKSVEAAAVQTSTPAAVAEKDRPRVDASTPLDSLLAMAVAARASDLHIIAGRPVLLRVATELFPRTQAVPAEQVERFAKEIVPVRVREVLDKEGACDFAVEHSTHGRFRVNASRQRTGFKLSLRVIPKETPTLAALGLPEAITNGLRHQRGLFLITGPASQGKSTTLAALVDHLNRETARHIVTIEAPIEHLHTRKKSLVSQREVGLHARSKTRAIQAAFREDSDVLVIGELREAESVRLALAAAESGRLVLATMNMPSAAKTLERILDLFAPAEVPLIRSGLAALLRLIVGQRLVPSSDRTRLHAAVELLPWSVALYGLVRDGRMHQIPNLQQRGKPLGIVRLDESLAELVRAQKVTLEVAKQFAESPADLETQAARPAAAAQARK